MKRLLYVLLYSLLFSFSSLFGLIDGVYNNTVYPPEKDSSGICHPEWYLNHETAISVETCSNYNLYNDTNLYTAISAKSFSRWLDFECYVDSQGYAWTSVTYSEGTECTFECADSTMIEQDGICKAPTDPDADGDGIPDKCDPDAAGYSTLDCDGDGSANHADPDIDGDGTPNENDAAPTDASNSKSCAPLPPFVITTTSLSRLECSKSHPSALVPDDSIFYLSYVAWDLCRDICTAHKQYCPKNQVTKAGECVEVKPDASTCQGTMDCYSVGIGVSDGNTNSTYGCLRKCHCLTSFSEQRSSANLVFSKEVSCDEQEEPEDDGLNDSEYDDTNSSEIIDPLADLNGTIQADNAQSFKAALESYQAAKEETQVKQGKELEKQTAELEKQTKEQKQIVEHLESLKTIAENSKAASSENAASTNALLNDLKNSNSKESTQQDVLSKLDDILNSQLSKADMTEAFADANISVNLNTNDTGDSNSSGSGEPSDDNSSSSGWSEQELKDKIVEQFTKRYTIIDTDCGAPVFDPSITFMGTTIDNPLPIMHEHTEEYFDQVKVLVILSATLLGFLTIFRR